MALKAYVDGVYIGDVRLRIRGSGDQSAMAAGSANGEGIQGSIVIDDPTYDYAAQGFQQISIVEDDCTDAPVLMYGYIADQTYGRAAHYRVGHERQIDITINDPNVLLEMPIFGQGSANRPEETDAARLTWLFAQTQMQLVQDLGLVNPSGQIQDASNFIGSHPFDVLNSLIADRGRIFFVYYKQDDDALGLFYDEPIATTFTSTLSLTNDRSEVTFDANDEPTGTVFPVAHAEMFSDPSQVYCQLRLVCSGFVSIYHSDATHAAYFSNFPANFHRSLNLDFPRITSHTRADHLGIQLLEHYSVEHRNVRGMVPLPSDKAGLIQPGQRINLHFTHLPELGLVGQYYRLEEVQWTKREDQTRGNPQQWYDVEFDASVHGFANVNPGSGGGGTPPPQQPPEDASVVQWTSGNSGGGAFQVIFDDPVSVGHVVVVASVWRDGQTDGSAVDTNDPPGFGESHNYVAFTQIGTGTIHSISSQSGWLHARLVTADDFANGSPGDRYTFGAGAGSGRPKFIAWELAGVGLPTGSPEVLTNQAGATFSFASLAEVAGITIGMMGWGTDDPTPVTFGPNDHLHTEVGDSFWMTISGIDRVRSASGSQVYSGSKGASGGDNTYMGVVANFPSSAGDTPPLHGQWTEWAVVSTTIGSGITSATTAFPFAAGSLEVRVDGVDILSSHVIVDDNTTGDFHLDWAIDSDEIVTVRYQGL